MSWLQHRQIRSSLLFLLGLICCLWIGKTPLWHLPVQAATPPVELARSDQGLASYQSGRLADAIAHWERALTQTSDPGDRAILYTNLGQAYRQIGRPDRAIAQWEKAIELQRRQGQSANRAIAQLLTEQAQAYGDLGQHAIAVERSQTAISLAQGAQDRQTEAAAQGALGTAYWSLGEYDPALMAHQQSLTLACQLNHANYTATALNNLGNVFVSRADRFQYQADGAKLEGDDTEAVALARQANYNRNLAIAAYGQSRDTSPIADPTATKALLNLNRLLQELPPHTVISSIPELTCSQLNITALLNPNFQRKPANTPSIAPGKLTPPNPIRPNQSSNQAEILTRLETEPDSQDKAFGYIDLANSLMQGEAAQPAQLQPILEQALTVARRVGDARAESFALGTLGRVYELSGQFDQAIAFTRQAQFVAQQVNAADSLYRWQWQSGRIFKATGQPTPAIAAYEQAIATLQTIRSDIISASKDLQFDFRDSVEPVYRELIGLLLAIDNPSPPLSKRSRGDQYASSKPSFSAHVTTKTNTIERVLAIFELLKLAELQDFFGDECVQVAKGTAEGSLVQNNPSAITPHTAVIYSVVLDDRSYLLARLPNGSLKKYPIQLDDKGKSVMASRALLQTRIDRLRSLLEKRSTDEYLTEAQSLYEALIRPLEPDLQAAKVATLVFIHDGILRKVPMAALHDGNQFLIEKYPIATTPSLALTSQRSLNRDNLKALVVGLTLEQPPFAALPNVAAEVEEVYQRLGGSRLIDQEFTLRGVQERLKQNSYPIIHMATHGKFGGDQESTFLLSYRDRISMEQLDQILRSRPGDRPVELLTLSACQTAAGDERSALGIAGLAVRAGVRSAMATLWFINDEATVPLMEEFYTQLLKPGTTKAEALQRAQVKLISDVQYNHPAVWSPFILIGSWT